LLVRDPEHLRRVLVDAGEEERLGAALLLMADEDVRGARRVRMPDVGRAVHVVDRCRQVVAHREQWYAWAFAPPAGGRGRRRAARGERRRHRTAGTRDRHCELLTAEATRVAARARAGLAAGERRRRAAATVHGTRAPRTRA